MPCHIFSTNGVSHQRCYRRYDRRHGGFIKSSVVRHDLSGGATRTRDHKGALERLNQIRKELRFRKRFLRAEEKVTKYTTEAWAEQHFGDDRRLAFGSESSQALFFGYVPTESVIDDVLVSGLKIEDPSSMLGKQSGIRKRCCDRWHDLLVVA